MAVSVATTSFDMTSEDFQVLAVALHAGRDTECLYTGEDACDTACKALLKFVGTIVTANGCGFALRALQKCTSDPCIGREIAKIAIGQSHVDIMLDFAAAQGYMPSIGACCVPLKVRRGAVVTTLEDDLTNEQVTARAILNIYKRSQATGVLQWQSKKGALCTWPLCELVMSRALSGVFVPQFRSVATVILCLVNDPPDQSWLQTPLDLSQCYLWSHEFQDDSYGAAGTLQAWVEGHRRVLTAVTGLRSPP